eukprot:COSAG06_NODE_2510_length_6740_cov_25.711683_2_plen_403_part_00
MVEAYHARYSKLHSGSSGYLNPPLRSGGAGPSGVGAADRIIGDRPGSHNMPIRADHERLREEKTMSSNGGAYEQLERTDRPRETMAPRQDLEAQPLLGTVRWGEEEEEEEEDPRSYTDKQSRQRTQQLSERFAALAAKKPALAKVAEANGLLVTSAGEGGDSAAETERQRFVVGERVEKRDIGKEWSPGYVTQLDPLRVTASYTDSAANGCPYDEVRKLSSEPVTAEQIAGLSRENTDGPAPPGKTGGHDSSDNVAITVAEELHEVHEQVAEHKEFEETVHAGHGHAAIKHAHENGHGQATGHDAPMVGNTLEKAWELLRGGAGDLLEQWYIAVGWLQTFSLLTVADFVDWPEDWYAYFSWMRLSFNFDDWFAWIRWLRSLSFLSLLTSMSQFHKLRKSLAS